MNPESQQKICRQPQNPVAVLRQNRRTLLGKRNKIFAIKKSVKPKKQRADFAAEYPKRILGRKKFIGAQKDHNTEDKTGNKRINKNLSQNEHYKGKEQKGNIKFFCVEKG